MDFEALDGEPVRLVFLIGTPKRRHLSTYLSVLARLTRLLEKSAFREKLLEARNTEEVLAAFNRIED
jgi:mannitol/fructose-specific phosphotransferase system IIA component (Ntr-type)